MLLGQQVRQRRAARSRECVVWTAACKERAEQAPERNSLPRLRERIVVLCSKMAAMEIMPSSPTRPTGRKQQWRQGGLSRERRKKNAQRRSSV